MLGGSQARSSGCVYRAEPLQPSPLSERATVSGRGIFTGMWYRFSPSSSPKKYFKKGQLSIFMYTLLRHLNFWCFQYIILLLFFILFSFCTTMILGIKWHISFSTNDPVYPFCKLQIAVLWREIYNVGTHRKIHRKPIGNVVRHHKISIII